MFGIELSYLLKADLDPKGEYTMEHCVLQNKTGNIAAKTKKTQFKH
jgi:hypothetical protein